MRYFSHNIQWRKWVGLTFFTCLLNVCFHKKCYAQEENHIRKKFEIKGSISPKSVVASNNGLFAAQNMMYRHTVTLYNQKGRQLAKIPDAVRLNDFGITKYGNTKFKGAPVEGVFTNNGAFLWVSNYHMSGKGFNNHGCDQCIGKAYDNSFLYKINTSTFNIENVIEVGAVPKFMAVSADETRLIVSNWVSSDISIIDLTTETVLKNVTVGAHPRGVAITQDTKKAYVTIMGSTKIAVVDLTNYTVNYITNVGKAPRSLILADNDSTLYVSLNASNSILKYNCYTTEKISCKTPSGPRSMTLDPSENYLYVVNYFDNTFSKINTDSMLLKTTVTTNAKPIGICANWKTAEIWVACYSGTIEVFKDFDLDQHLYPEDWFGIDLALFNFDAFVSTTIGTNSAKVTKKANTLDTSRIELLTAETDTPNNIITLATTEEYQTDIATVTPKTKNTAIKRHTKPTTTCNYYIIVGAFSIPENAENKKNELLEKGYNAVTLKGSKLTYVSADCAFTETNAETKKQAIKTNLAGAESAWVLER